MMIPDPNSKAVPEALPDAVPEPDSGAASDPVFEALIVFARQPAVYRAKTRLSPPLTPQAAASLYACFLDDTLQLARQVHGVDLILAYDPPEAHAYFTTLAPGFHCLPQSGDGLGQRMHLALSALLARGCRHAVLIGSDLPHLDPALIRQAFDALDSNSLSPWGEGRVRGSSADLVLGPSLDGGYYLVGLSRPYPDLFTVPMSTPTVLQDTLDISRRLGLRTHLLPQQRDVDTFDDLQALAAQLSAATPQQIPAARTRAWLAAWLPALLVPPR